MRHRGPRDHQQAVEERGLDHFVIASCSPRFQGPTFERIARELRLGENAVAFGNIREGCSFVHTDEPERAQVKAKKIVEGAVAWQHMSDLPRQRTFLNRSALVVGGGIAGISAAEELAAAGIEVHLVERQQSIGRLHGPAQRRPSRPRTAPCAASRRGSPARRTNSRIHIHSLSDVTSVTGPPGEFSITVRHRPRYVNENCVGCGECAAVCPVTYPNEFDFGVSERTAIARPFANAVPATFAVDRKGWSPCKTACPVHTSAQGYVALVAKGRYEEAYRVASEPNPFPSVCGRICTHVCETERTRGNVEEPIAIAGIKRFVADRRRAGGAAARAARLRRRADGHRRRRPRRPHRRARARGVRLQGDRVRGSAGRRRHAARLASPSTACRVPSCRARSTESAALGVELKTGQRCGTDFTVDGRSPTATRPCFLATGLHQKQATCRSRWPRPAGRRAAPSSSCARRRSARTRPPASAWS